MSSKEETLSNAAPYDYTSIPVGYYDDILRTGSPVRRAWHLQKFERFLDALPLSDGGSLLDIGCFSGTFLSMIPEERFQHQLGVDILPEQISYANERFGTPFRRFQPIANLAALAAIDEKFDHVTLIEVIEHLTENEIRTLFEQLNRLIAPGGRLLLSTPNYCSTWPILEILINKLADISYEEQHLTKFTAFNFESKLSRIVPSFSKSFVVESKTTTHFLSPFMASLSFDFAMKLSRFVKHNRWHMPFGNLVLAVLKRTEDESPHTSPHNA